MGLKVKDKTVIDSEGVIIATLEFKKNEIYFMLVDKSADRESMIKLLKEFSEA